MTGMERENVELKRRIELISRVRWGAPQPQIGIFDAEGSQQNLLDSQNERDSERSRHSNNQ